MNERIRELVKRAGGHFYTHNLMSNPVQHRESIELWDKNIEKFAELIVRECIGQMELVRKYRYDRIQPLENQQTIIDECQYQIKQHFGVEE